MKNSKMQFYLKMVSTILAVSILMSMIPLSSLAVNDSKIKVTEEIQRLSWEDKISEELWKKINSTDNLEKISVCIWFFDIDSNEIENKVQKETGFTSETIAMDVSKYDILENLSVNGTAGIRGLDDRLEKTVFELREQEEAQTKLYMESKRKISREMYDDHNNELISEMEINRKDIDFTSQYSPMIIVDLTVDEIKTKAQNNNVESIDLYVEQKPVYPTEDMTTEVLNEYNLTKSIEGIDYVHAYYGLRGSGIKMGIYGDFIYQDGVSGEIKGEQVTLSGLTDLPTDRIVYLAANQSNLDNPAYYSHHTTYATARLAAGDHGIAPECTMYSVSLVECGNNFYAGMERFIDNNINLINMGFIFPRVSAYGQIEKWIDYITEKYNLTVIVPAGNDFNLPIGVPGLARNVITVNGYDNKGTSTSDDDTLITYSYLNKYTDGAGCLKPDVVASSNFPGNGTSHSAPFVAGVVALMMEAKPSLKTQPETVKAILMASCHRKANPSTKYPSQMETMFNGITNEQGAGIIDAVKAIEIVTKYQYRRRTVNIEDSFDFFLGNDQYNMQCQMNVSLSWLQTGGIEGSNYNVTSGKIQDLDLHVYNPGNTVACGSSSNANSTTELVYTNVDTSTKQVKVKHYNYNSSAPETISYTVAWSVTPLPLAKVAAGGRHSMMLHTDGSVWTSGANTYGQLGNGTTTQSTRYVKTNNLNDMIEIAAGEYHSIALKDDGTVWTWGKNTYGQLGNGNTTSRSTPAKISGLSDVIAISAGENFSMALKKDGTVWTWGVNFCGQLGNNSQAHSYTPVQVVNSDNTAFTDVIAISAGDKHSLALKKDGTVYSWGYRNKGQCGVGAIGEICYKTPVMIPSLDGITAISGGFLYSMALKKDGTMWTWGYNGNGQLGDGTTINRSQPVEIQNFNKITAISAGKDFSMALKNNGIDTWSNSVYTWGDNSKGQLCTNNNVSRTSPGTTYGLGFTAAISAGYSHGINVHGYGWGYVGAWGNNANGQIGVGNTSDTNTSYVFSSMVRYDANGGVNTPNNQIKMRHLPLTLTNSEPTRIGYTFKGWATSSTATSPTYLPGGIFTNGIGCTLYAVWEKN